MAERKMEMAITEGVVIEDAVIERLIVYMETARDVQFAIGDEVLRQVKLHGGNRAGVINYLSSQLGVSASVLYDYCRIAEVWSPELREVYQALDWTIYRNTNPSDPQDIELLERAVDEGWNATRFKEEKYPALKEPKTVIEKVRAMLIRGKKSWSVELSEEIDIVLSRLEAILRKYEAQSRQQSE